MFDPGFFELIVICIVALVVLGPERLPGAVRTMGLWIGRLRRSFNNIKREIEQEVGADEIRRQLRNEAIMEKFNSTKKQFNDSVQSIKNEADSVKEDLNLKKEFTNLTGANQNNDMPAGNEDDNDPVEKLATSDPAARTVKPVTEETPPEPASNNAEETAQSKPAGDN